MDAEEIRKKRREKILQRSGIKAEEEPKEIVPQDEELSITERLEMIESIEEYKVFLK